MTRVAIYARVSTGNGRQDPEMQLRDLRELAQFRQWQVVKEYVDHITGSKESRPQLNQLMTDAKRRRFDTVLVWKLDRFGRSLKHLVNSLAELEGVGIAFVSMRDNLDLTTPSGRLMFQIIGAMAEFERALIQEGVRAGIRNAKAKGVHVGRPRQQFNFERIAELRSRTPCPSWRDLAKQFGTKAGTLHRAFIRWNACHQNPSKAAPATLVESVAV